MKKSTRGEKRKIAQLAFTEIEKAMEKVQQDFPNEFGFCWDECIWVDNEFFASRDEIFTEETTQR
jgi:hypothetical protein